MRDESGGAVANALHHANGLRSLDLSSNEITERAAMVIAGALKRTAFDCDSHELQNLVLSVTDWIFPMFRDFS